MTTQIHVGQLPRADGSSLFVSPEGVVQCAVYGPLDVPFHKEMPGKATLEVVVKRGCKSKESSAGMKGDQELIRKLFESVVMVDLYPRSGIEIIVQEMESDGDLLSLAINCITAALLDAGLSMSSIVASVTVTITSDGRVLVNPDKESLEDSPTRLVIVHQSTDSRTDSRTDSSIIAIHSTGDPCEMGQLKECFRVSRDAADQMFLLFRDTIRNNMFVG